LTFGFFCLSFTHQFYPALTASRSWPLGLALIVLSLIIFSYFGLLCVAFICIRSHHNLPSSSFCVVISLSSSSLSSSSLSLSRQTDCLPPTDVWIRGRTVRVLFPLAGVFVAEDGAMLTAASVSASPSSPDAQPRPACAGDLVQIRVRATCQPADLGVDVPMSVVIGAHDVLPLIEELLSGMSVGDCRSVALTEHELALPLLFGTADVLPEQLFVELVSLDRAAPPATVAATVLAAATAHKEQGNAAFGRRDFPAALEHYQRATATLLEIPADLRFSATEQLHREQGLLAIRLNTAQAHLSLHDPAAALAVLNLVLQDEPDHPKAHFQAAKAHEAVQNYPAARRHLEELVEIAPSPAVDAALRHLQEAERKYQAQQVSLYSQLFE
jgi:hypothetical protein